MAATATPRATAVTWTTVDIVSGGAPARPTRPTLGSVSRGATSQPVANPAAAANRAIGDVLGEQDGGDDARRAADGLEQSDPSGLVGHATADEDGDAGHGEQADQPAADHQHLPLVPDQLGGLVADVLPRHHPASLDSVAGVLGDERAGGGRVSQRQVHDAGGAPPRLAVAGALVGRQAERVGLA